MKDKRHWYCFSYFGDELESGKQCNSSQYTGLEKKGVRRMDIEESKKYAGVAKEAVLISCSYLGHMTEQEFTQQEEK